MLLFVRRKGAALVFLFLFCSGCFSVSPEINSARPDSYGRELNLVFVPLHYQDKKDFLKDKEALIEKLRTEAPFSEFPKAIKIWDLKISEGRAQKIFFFKNTFPPLTVAPDFLKEVFTRVGSNYKLILLDKTGTTGCAALASFEETSVILLGRQRFWSGAIFARGFLHELGHSLGLRDESIEEHARFCDPGYPNCASTRQEAEKWWGDLAGKDPWTGFFRGCCGRPDYFRPTAVSLMNDFYKSSHFGPVNERYLREAFGKAKSGSGPGNGED